MAAEQARTLVLTNARIYQSPDASDGPPVFAEALVAQDGVITHVGFENDAAIAEARQSANVRDLQGQTVLPGFIDGHVHLLMLGQALTKASLDGSQDFGEIRARIKAHAAANPDAPRLFCRGWMHSMTPDGVDARMLDEIDTRPMFVDSKDLHFTWCNSAAMKEMNVEHEPDPQGGAIRRDSSGKPTGLFEEAAVYQIVLPHIARVSPMAEKAAAIRAAIEAYQSVGYTGIIDMAMDESMWEPLLELRKSGGLNGMRISAYWLVKPAKSIDEVLVQVDKAASLAAEYKTHDCRVVGIKLICDGIIDACTAALTEPYTTNANPDTIWSEADLHSIVARAHQHSLQVALHAIGDRTVTMAVNVLERNTDASRRPRIEHLEMTTPADARRLGKLGVTASIQPVHSDPAILRAWPRLLGADRCKRAFAYREFLDGGAPIALGSDAPTAPHAPLPNCYVATTRRSAREPESEETVNPEYVLTVCQTIAGASHGSAYSCFMDKVTGSLKPGLKADFVVCDIDLVPEGFLKGVIKETWFEGRQVYQNAKS